MTSRLTKYEKETVLLYNQSQDPITISTYDPGLRRRLRDDVQTVLIRESNVFKGVPVEYDAEYFYCDKADETYADEQQISANDIAMKNAYRVASGLLTSDQIAAIRARYGISQSDLCLLLGWGAKTITRYESHQVQDIAHDTILRKLASDPEWFLKLLDTAKASLSPASYAKYREAGTALFEQDHDLYLKSAIMAKYARYQHNPEYTGNASLSLDVVVDMIHYYANSAKVTSLYRVKLMKLLWYADALSYKRRGHAISGMVYRAMPMGAVPVAYESIVDLSTINCEEIDMGYGHESSKFTWQMAHIPLFIAYSDSFEEDAPEIFAVLRDNRNRPWTNDLLYDLLVHVMGMTNAPSYQSEYDLSSPSYSMSADGLRTLHGHKAIRDDPALRTANK